MTDPRQIVFVVSSDTGAQLDLAHLLAAHGLRAADIEPACRVLNLTHPDEMEQLVCAVRTAVDLGRNARAYRDRYERLTAREREVLSLVVSGLLNKQVASKLGISQVTVQIHRSRVMVKMGASSFADLVRMSTGTDLGLTA